MPDASKLDTPRESLRAGRRAQTFVATPEWVVFSGVSPQAIALYTVLLAHVNRERRDGIVWPGMGSLAAMLGFKQRKSVQRYLGELVALGAVDVDRERSMRRRNLYTVHETPPDGYAGPRSLREYYERVGSGESSENVEVDDETAGQRRRGTEVPLRRGTEVPLARGTEVPQNQTKRTRRSRTSASSAASTESTVRKGFASGAASTGSTRRVDRGSAERRRELPVDRSWLSYDNPRLDVDLLDHVCAVHGAEPPGLAALVDSLVGRELEVAPGARKHPMFLLNVALKYAREETLSA